MAAKTVSQTLNIPIFKVWDSVFCMSWIYCQKTHHTEISNTNPKYESKRSCDCHSWDEFTLFVLEHFSECYQRCFFKSLIGVYLLQTQKHGTMQAASRTWTGQTWSETRLCAYFNLAVTSFLFHTITWIGLVITV